MFRIGVYELLPIAVLLVVFLWPMWRIFAKAGFPGWYALGLFVPIVNVLAMFYLAYAEWPALSAQDSGGDRAGHV